MVIYLIRHGATPGNRLGRYIGVTDEVLSEQGRRELSKAKLPSCVDGLYVSPMLRCRQTAEILYPDVRQRIVPGFRECDFGLFENKNYRELSGEPGYQAWIDSGGTMDFPGGEHLEDFRRRSVEAFLQVCDEARREEMEQAACVVHGGTIMAVMSALAVPRGEYYDYQVKNGGGYAVCLHGKENLPGVPEHMVDFRLSIWYAF